MSGQCAATRRPRKRLTHAEPLVNMLLGSATVKVELHPSHLCVWAAKPKFATWRGSSLAAPTSLTCRLTVRFRIPYQRALVAYFAPA